MNIKLTESDNLKNQINIIPIIIIGSGISGLTIASKIKNKDFLILEARDRIGGRVFTNESGMDIGAAWLHGSDSNPLNEYLNFDNMLPVSNSNPWMHSENTNIKYMNNKYNITEEKRQILASKWNKLASEIGNKNDQTIIKGFEDASNNNLTEDEYNDIFSFLYMTEVWCGGSVKNISAGFLNEKNNPNALFGDYAGSHYLFKNGAQTLIDGIIKSSYTSIYDKIKYNQIVTKVVNKDSYVEVHTSNNQTYYCKQLCVTIPPGPLKNIEFCPRLDNKRLDSLSRIKLGSYKKVQLEFMEDEVFWDENNNCPMFLTYNSKMSGKEYYLHNNENNEVFPYILWNNYKYSKNKPILEAIFPADIGWKLTGMSDDTIVQMAIAQLNNYYPNIHIPKPKA